MLVVTHETSRGTLGTFAGVFTPSILTILGIILFLRLGFAVGNAGLRNGLIIIAIANGVSILTSISVAAIATNIDVKGGGDYYMISRTLGVEFGGAIGIVLFLAQSVSIGFYVVGFGEAVAAIGGWEADWAPQIVAVVAVVVLFGLAWLGADAASRFQFVVMGLLVAALLSFYVGAIGGFDADLVTDGWTRPEGALGFWAVFAIFFPAVTGFTQGVSMSGDLREPGRSLPLGTFAAVGLSIIVYLTVAVLLAGNATSQQLIDNTGIMNSVAAFGPLIDAGVIAATLSSAMASFLGAPRILQSLAADCAGDHRHWEPQRHRSRRVDVLPHLVRAAELRDVLRSPGRQPLLPAAVPLLRSPAQPRRDDRMFRGDARHQPAHRRPRHCDPPRDPPVPAAARSAAAVGRRQPFVSLPAGQREHSGNDRRSLESPQLAAAGAGVLRRSTSSRAAPPVCVVARGVEWPHRGGRDRRR